MSRVTRIWPAVSLICALAATPLAAQDVGKPVPPVPKLPPAEKPKDSSAVPEIVKAGPQEKAEAALCRQVLRALGAEFKVLKPVSGKGECRIGNAVELSSLAHGIKLRPAATLNCSMAVMLASFAVREVKAMAEDKIGKPPASLRVGASYKCRSRNNKPGARISEHAFGNAIDIMGFGFEDRDPILVEGPHAEGSPEHAFLAALGKRSCAYFTTVLGPISDEAHKDHWHFDIRARKRDWRLCFTYPEANQGAAK